MVAIENHLTDLLGVRVDLSAAKTLKEPVLHQAKREAALAFSEASLSLTDRPSSM
jgi:predicted nucleotidyltransferase